MWIYFNTQNDEIQIKNPIIIIFFIKENFVINSIYIYIYTYTLLIKKLENVSMWLLVYTIDIMSFVLFEETWTQRNTTDNWRLGMNHSS